MSQKIDVMERVKKFKLFTRVLIRVQLESHFHKTRLNRSVEERLCYFWRVFGRYKHSIRFINDGRALLQRQLARRSPAGLCGERQRAQLDSAGRRPPARAARPAAQRCLGRARRGGRHLQTRCATHVGAPALAARDSRRRAKAC
jgi:hypothetical protein